MIKQASTVGFPEKCDNIGKEGSSVSGKEVKVLHSVVEIGRDALDSISNDGFFTYEWFRTLEAQQSFQVSPIYVAIYDEGKLVAVAPCFADLFDDYFLFGPRLRYIMPFLKRLLNLGRRYGFCQNHVLLCYSPFCARSKILRGKNLEDVLILRLLSNKIDEICKKQRFLFSSFLFVSEFDELLMKNLGNLGYLLSPGTTTLYLNVKWSSFEDYLRSLKRRKAHDIKREIRKCAENGITIEERDFRDLSMKLSELSSALRSKYDKTSKCGFDSSFFSTLNKHARYNTKVFVAEKNDEVIGFSLFLRHRDVLDGFMAGFDYQAQTKTDFAYFNVCYYAPIRWAIDEGIKKIYYRFKAEKVKLDRGCKPERTFSFVRCHNAVLESLISIAAKNPVYSYLKLRFLRKTL